MQLQAIMQRKKWREQGPDAGGDRRFVPFRIAADPGMSPMEDFPPPGRFWGEWIPKPASPIADPVHSGGSCRGRIRSVKRRIRRKDAEGRENRFGFDEAGFPLRAPRLRVKKIRIGAQPR
jgi:hypothetical protein